MRAVVMSGCGGPEVLKVEEVPRPALILTQVLMRVRAAGVNPVDRYVRSGAFPLLRPPAILGWDVSGVVEDVFPASHASASGRGLREALLPPRRGRRMPSTSPRPRASSRRSRRVSITSRRRGPRWRASRRGRGWSTSRW